MDEVYIPSVCVPADMLSTPLPSLDTWLVNGMSYSGRNGENANSAVIVTVSPEDYPGEGPLAGVEFQRRAGRSGLEGRDRGRIPVQRFQDFCRTSLPQDPGRFFPRSKAHYTWTNVRPIFPQ